MVSNDDDSSLKCMNYDLMGLTFGEHAEAAGTVYLKLPPSLPSSEDVSDDVDEEDDKLLTTVTERPPSSAGSDDSGCYNSDVSDEENNGTCIADSVTLWPETAVSPTPSYQSRDVAPRRHEIVSVLRPTVTDVCFHCSTLTTDNVISIDLTDRCDVTYSIEHLHYPALPTSAASSTGSDVSSQPSDTDQEDCLSRKSLSESECSDDVEFGCEKHSPGPRLPSDIGPSTTCDVDDLKASKETNCGKSSPRWCNQNNASRRQYRNRREGAPVWNLSGMMTALVPGCLIIPPPVLGYIVLKPVNCSSSSNTQMGGDFSLMPSKPAVRLCTSGIQHTPLVVMPNAHERLIYGRNPRRFLNTLRSPAPSRRWLSYNSDSPQQTTHKVNLRVMTYNVLAKKLATTERFRYCPHWVLSWEYRKSLILNEIMARKADVIALQEVELREYVNFFQPQLAALGYNGVFALKSRARTMSVEEQLDVDGCAIFYKSNKFAVVSSHVIEFNSLALHATVDLELEQNHDFLHRVLSRDNVGLAVLLQTTRDAWSGEAPMSVSEPILVATAHLFWDPEYPDVKLIQTMLLTHELRRIMASVPVHLRPSCSADQHVPLILAGDFNALPDSGVVSYLRRGRIDASHADFCGLDYVSCLRKLNDVSAVGGEDVADSSPTVVSFSHGLQLAVVDCMLSFTNYTSWFRGVIDHVFYTFNVNIRPVRALQGLCTDWLRRNDVIGLPTPDMPSDHISLVVDFELTPSSRVASHVDRRT